MNDIEGVSECSIPPKGWRCTRVAGHDGPCAAIPMDMSEDAKEYLARLAHVAEEVKKWPLWKQGQVGVTTPNKLPMGSEQPKQPEAAVEDAKPAAWMYRELINKHITGDLRPGEIQIGEIKGMPSSVFALSFNEPRRACVEKIPLYCHPDRGTMREKGGEVDGAH